MPNTLLSSINHITSSATHLLRNSVRSYRFFRRHIAIDKTVCIIENMFSVPANFAPSVHISPQAQLVSQIILLVLAVLCVIARTAIRLYYKKLYEDDYFLFLGTASLISGAVVRLCAIIANQKIDPLAPPEVELKQALGVIWLNTMPQILSSLTIYCVKFSFLFYFKGILRRQPKTTKWWWCVLFVLIIVAPPSIFANFISCPVDTAVAMEMCTLTPGFERRELIATYYFVAADIITDLLLISIPICILRQTTISLRQKLTIGVILCLSIFQIAIALIRGIGLEVYGTSDETWIAFWPNTEASVAIIMVCGTAFRTLFTENRNASKPEGPRVVKAPITWSTLKTKVPNNQYIKIVKIFGASSGNSSRVDV
ncbi:hypothetical protein MMC18_003042 [Xylographa bjoerkii]|nr:hypothetical protein [Xylographa bjoerkii]